MAKHQNVISYLKERGFVNVLTSENLYKACEKPIKVYVGFDPTAASLHVGNLIGIMALAHMQRFGHTPFVILGGMTGKIGDPSGKSSERPLLDTATIQHNVESISTHFQQILDFKGSENKPVILNNDDWFSRFTITDFLREVGKHFRIGEMLAKESVRARLQSEEGMSFTEFSYQLIQAYDFYHLHEVYGVCLQMGGSDQWGNITAGIELTRKMARKEVYGLTWPLLTRSDGKKFGKSESGAVWLLKERCSFYEFYQYFIRTADADVIHLLKMFTFIEMEEILEIETEMASSSYKPNTAQKRLAEEVTRIVHGKEGLETALRVTEGAAPGKETKLDAESLREIVADMPSACLPKSKVVGAKYIEVAAAALFLPSKAEGGRLIQNGGAYLNNQKVNDPQLLIEEKDLIDGQFVILGAGKKRKMLIKVT